jgi:hypothetical protein
MQPPEFLLTPQDMARILVVSPATPVDLHKRAKSKGNDNPVVEHKGVYPRLGSEERILLWAQSLTWDTLCAERSQISPVGVLLQSIQQLPWDTLSHLRETDEIAGILITFYFVRAIRPLGQPSQNILRIPQKFLLRTVADLPSKKSLSRCGFLVAYRVEAMK